MSILLPAGMDKTTGQFKVAQSGDFFCVSDHGTAGTATVAGGAGIALFYPTSDGTSSGTALYQSIKFVHAAFTSNDPNLGRSISISGDLKTITITCMKQTFTGVTILGINALGTNVISAAPNGTTLNVLVQGTLA